MEEGLLKSRRSPRYMNGISERQSRSAGGPDLDDIYCGVQMYFDAIGSPQGGGWRCRSF